METRYVAPASQVYEWQFVPPRADRTCDVLVVGGGLSGCAAATAAARAGARVILVESYHLLGGQMTASGVGSVDAANNWGATNEQGIYLEVVSAIRRIYDEELGQSTETAMYQRPSTAASAPVVDRVLRNLVRNAGVELLGNTDVTACEVDERRARAETSAGRIDAAVVVDATETGELLALAGFDHRLGSRVVTAQDRPDAARIKIQDTTQVAVLRRYDNGIPPHLRMSSAPPGWDENRTWVEKSFPWRPGRKEGGSNDWAGYRGLPDMASVESYTVDELDRITRSALNYTNDIPATADMLTDPDALRRLRRRAIERTLAIIYHLQVGLQQQWAVAEDEGFVEGPATRRIPVDGDLPEWVRHFPPRLYYRESRRLKGALTITSGSAGRSEGVEVPPWSPTALAAATYAYDLHGSYKPEDMEAELGETETTQVWRSGPIAIPFGAFVPADGRRLVVAEKNLSMSRTVSGSVRVHPSVMAVGQAAGVIAAGAARRDIAPRDVPVRWTQLVLSRQHALVLPAPVDGIAVHSEDHPAIALALVSGEVAFTVGKNRRLALDAASRKKALEVGRRMVAEAEKQ